MEHDLNLPIRFISGPEIHGSRITEDYPTLFGGSYQTTDTYDGQTSLLDAICHPYPASDHPVYSLQEAAYEGNQRLNNGNYGSGLHGCRGEKLFSCNCGNYGSGLRGCRVEKLFSCNRSSDGIGSECGCRLVPTEHARQTKEHYDTDFSYHENNEGQPAFDYNTCYESSSGFTGDIFNYDRRERRPIYGYSPEEMEFCEGIFSYWPCLLPEMQQSHVQQ